MICCMSSGRAAIARDEPRRRPPLRRRPEEGLLGGVCAGVARRLDANVNVVRVLAAAIAAAGGVGVAIYGLAWALVPVDPDSEGRRRRPGAWREAVLIAVGVAVSLWALRALGLGIEQSVVWPAVIGACGLVLVWQPVVGEAPQVPPPEDESSLRGRLRGAARLDWPRVTLGALMVAFAVAWLLHSFAVLHTLGKAIGAVAIVAAVFGVLIVPWFVRLAGSLGTERAARIREQERAEVAAHLHDSVLQTLALIQKRAGDPREVGALARRQERELRAWLHDGRVAPEADTVAAALRRAAAEVEELHRVPIEVVTVGDRPLDQPLEAIVLAAREAMINAAKFAGSDHIDLYAEVADEGTEVFVRDRGVGFDTLSVPPDRRGLRDSIQGRMERHRGIATVRSRLGEGTEVELKLETV
jgi:signal transduction histidine kinase/phage shock protein PspC (stress-responsive transcriptional regulator)